ARSASCQAWKGSIEGGSAINYAARVANSANGTVLTTCGTGSLTGIGAVVSGGLPAANSGQAVSIVSGSIPNTNGSAGSCVIEYSAAGSTCQVTVNVNAIN